MIEMVLDQSALGLSDRLLHRMELLRDINAWSAALNHRDNAAEMTLGPLQALDDFGVGGVRVLGHASSILLEGIRVNGCK
jgi:hypothetical protein